MDVIIARFLGFFVDNIPSWPALLAGGPIGLAWSFGALWFAGLLKRRGVRTGYTRKVFHFCIFSTVALLQWKAGTSAVCLFGGTCSVAVFYAVWKGDGHILYEAMAREKDKPHRTFFILIPYLTTLAGGLFSAMVFGPVSIAGYLVAGLGDAIGEPVGTRFGKHQYRVRSLSSVPATRSIEGSAAVFIMSYAALVLAAILSPQISPGHGAVLKLGIIAAASTLAEALSPHGWDNATMQVVPSAMVWGWMT